MSADEFRERFRENARELGHMEGEPSEPEPAPEPEPSQPPERPRDEQGRYTAEAAAEETPAAAEPDPDVQAFLGKYGGDVDKALVAAVNQEKLIGRQGQELGELRKIQEQLSEMREELAPQDGYVDEATGSWFDNLVTESPEQAAVWAYQNQQAHLMDRAVEEWYAVDPRRAGQFERALEMQAMQRQWQEQLAPQQYDLSVRDMGAALQQAAQKFPELRDNAYVETLLERAPRSELREQKLHSGTVQERVEALEALAWMGRGMGITQQPAPNDQTAGNGDTGQAAPPTQRDLATAASVVSGSYSPTREVATSKVEAWREQFRNSPEFRKAAGLIDQDR